MIIFAILLILILIFALKTIFKNVATQFYMIQMGIDFKFRLKDEEKLSIFDNIHEKHPKYLYSKFMKLMFIYDPEISRRWVFDYLNKKKLLMPNLNFRVYISTSCMQRPYSEFVHVNKGLLFSTCKLLFQIEFIFINYFKSDDDWKQTRRVFDHSSTWKLWKVSFQYLSLLLIKLLMIWDIKSMLETLRCNRT